MADLLFIMFGFSCFAYVELTSALLVWTNPNKSNRKSAVPMVSVLWLMLIYYSVALKAHSDGLRKTQ